MSGNPAGYFELEGKPGSDIEIAYFGLLPQFVGKGLGGYLLTEAVRRARRKRGDSGLGTHLFVRSSERFAELSSPRLSAFQGGNDFQGTPRLSARCMARGRASWRPLLMCLEVVQGRVRLRPRSIAAILW